MKAFSKYEACSTRRGSILVLVLWICFGLVALTVYFANTVSLEARAAGNRVGNLAAREAVEAGIRYAEYVLNQYGSGGSLPKSTDYKAEGLRVGESRFWFIGRDNNQVQRNAREPVFGLVDEASKLNLNTASAATLQGLPDMTAEFAGAIVDWRDSNSSISSGGGAEDESYGSLSPARRCKNAPFETTDELRLVYGSDMALLLGEDANRNGVLDSSEDNGAESLPADDSNGVLRPGMLDFVTVYSSQPATSASGQRAINVTDLTARPQLQQLFTEQLGETRARELMQAIGQRPLTSVLQLIQLSRMTADEYTKVRDRLSSASGTVRGLVNVNTAPAEVLACLPGMDSSKAATLVSQRQSQGDSLGDFFWLTTVLDATTISQLGPRVTDRSYQVCADVAAVGPNGRGYARSRVVFDMSAGSPRIVYRQDLGSFGWALGSSARQSYNQETESNL